VPEHAPWAEHGYQRTAEQYEAAIQLMKDEEQGLAGQELARRVDQTAAALHAALNTMRPGNLAEPEDLKPLSDLMEKMRGKDYREMSQELRQAMRYAQMVTRYVNDGSGTMDMIKRAVGQLQPLVE
jgi:methyl-accepting chemotaxis protein